MVEVPLSSSQSGGGLLVSSGSGLEHLEGSLSGSLGVGELDSRLLELMPGLVPGLAGEAEVVLGFGEVALGLLEGILSLAKSVLSLVEILIGPVVVLLGVEEVGIGLGLSEFLLVEGRLG